MICSRGHLEPRRASAMSNRSFINRAAEERRQRLVVGRVVAQSPAARFVGCFERIEHGVHCLVGIGGLALPLHRVEIVHIGRIGLFIVAEQAHRIFRLKNSSRLTRFLHANRYPLRSKTLLSCLTRFLRANRYPLRSKTLSPTRRLSAPERNGLRWPARFSRSHRRSRRH